MSKDLTHGKILFFFYSFVVIMDSIIHGSNLAVIYKKWGEGRLKSNLRNSACRASSFEELQMSGIAVYC